jgi:hypothetical protein
MSDPYVSLFLSASDAFLISLLLSSCSDLSLLLKRLRETTHVVLEWALLPQKLHVRTIDAELTGLAALNVLLATQRCEAPVLGDDDLLAAGELVLAAAEGLDGGGTVYKFC